MQNLTVRQFAVHKGISLTRAYQIVWSNQLPGAHQVNGRWVIPIPEDRPAQPSHVPDWKAAAAHDEL